MITNGEPTDNHIVDMLSGEDIHHFSQRSFEDIVHGLKITYVTLVFLRHLPLHPLQQIQYHIDARRVHP